MVLGQNLQILTQELNLKFSPPSQDDVYTLEIGEFTLFLKNLNPGLFLYAPIGPLPEEGREDFLMLTMRANFLGEGTGGNVLGLTEDESCLTLSSSMPYELNYATFKETVEVFVNFLDYWKKEVATHAAKK